MKFTSLFTRLASRQTTVSRIARCMAIAALALFGTTEAKALNNWTYNSMPLPTLTDGTWAFSVIDHYDGTLTVTGLRSGQFPSPAQPLDFSGPVTDGGSGTYTIVGIGSGTCVIGNSDAATSLTLPNTVTNIGDNAFVNCANIQGGLDIPDSVVSIGSYAFANSGLNGQLVLGSAHGSALETIGSFAFWSDKFAGSLAFPDSLKSIGNYAFEYCTFDGVSHWGTLDTLCHSMFHWTSFATNLFVIPKQIESIGNYALYQTSFGGGNGLVVIGDGVKTIGDGSAPVISVNFDKISVPSTGVTFNNNVFAGGGGKAQIYFRGFFPASVASSVITYPPAGTTSYVSSAYVADWNVNNDPLAGGVDTSLGNIESGLATWQGYPIVVGEWDVSEYLGNFWWFTDSSQTVITDGTWE
ncbi:MAG: leucine-rich repeat domain-containing protein, partial [Kiritimatiellaeota bacterium]|nr:leucine-rich repeat domain-containing protein [Kiritimatiellota bacterium]